MITLTARVLTDNLADYHVPVNPDVAPIEVLFINQPDLALNDLGARGLGEIGLPGTAAAIGNAVYSATGRRFRHMPITPKDVVGPVGGAVALVGSATMPAAPAAALFNPLVGPSGRA